jgi:transposase
VKRLFWGLVGVGAGAAIGVSATRWASRTAERLAPGSLADRALEAAGDWRERLADALEEGQAAMAEREAELRALLAGPGSGDG